MSPEEASRQFAIAAHGDQKYGSDPYSVHLDAVHATLKEVGYGEDYLVAAYLHDVLEDTDTTTDQLELAFGSTVTRMVWSVTGEGKNRKERNENVYEKLREYPQAIALKCADRLANMRASLRDNPKLFSMYASEYDRFYNRLHHVSECNDERVHVLWKKLDEVTSTAPIFPEDRVYMYLVANTSLDMSGSKIGIQIGHGLQLFMQQIAGPMSLPVFGHLAYEARIKEWLATRYGKILLGADAKEFEKAKELQETHVTVVDDGHTEVAPGSETLLVFYPMRKSERPALLKRLRLL